MGRPESGASDYLFDNDIETGWNVPQVPGAALLIDMGRVNPANRIFFIPFPVPEERGRGAGFNRLEGIRQGQRRGGGKGGGRAPANPLEL